MGEKKKRRALELAVISDVHLGTRGSRAKELLKYLKSIKPKVLVLNGDIIDGWQFKKSYFPKAHTLVLKQVLGLMAKGTQVYYVTGNHDELMRRYVGFGMGDFNIVNKVVLNLDGKKAWIFHGDVFDVVMEHSKWLAKLGSIGYDLLIILNRFINEVSKRMGKGPISMSKKIKNSVKGAVKFINHFEETASQIAASNGYDYVVCGHIHTPEIRYFEYQEGNVTYLNSGDWIENLTGLEYNKGKWTIYSYLDDKEVHQQDDDNLEGEEPTYKELFKDLAKDVVPDLNIDSI